MKKHHFLRSILFFLLLILLFHWGLGLLNQGQQAQGLLILEDAVRKTAAACYAAEGFYPPNIAYMQEHYGLQWDPEAYVIHYERFASNLMPQITVLYIAYENENPIR